MHFDFDVGGYVRVCVYASAYECCAPEEGYSVKKTFHFKEF